VVVELGEESGAGPRATGAAVATGCGLGTPIRHGAVDAPFPSLLPGRPAEWGASLQRGCGEAFGSPGYCRAGSWRWRGLGEQDAARTVSADDGGGGVGIP